MHINLNINWSFGPGQGNEMDAGLFHLLENIRQQGTLKQAAELCGYSYRHAWGMLKHWENTFQSPLVKFERGRGHGAYLTALGDKLLWSNQLVIRKTAAQLAGLAKEIDSNLSEYTRADKQEKLRIYASHDIAITCVNDLIQNELGLKTEFQIHGSLESLRLLDIGECNIAGFHFPIDKLWQILAPQYKSWLENKKYRLIYVTTRNQGLMVQNNNPKTINGLSDLTRRDIKFINRQRGSGTRTIFDQLLIQEGIQQKNITGYKDEEFTHVAVAAMVASGIADTGFGIQAAASQFGLQFIPVLQEAYALALHDRLDENLADSIKKIIRSKKFKQKMSGATGYGFKQSGKDIKLDKIFGESK